MFFSSPFNPNDVLVMQLQILGKCLLTVFLRWHKKNDKVNILMLNNTLPILGNGSVNVIIGEKVPPKKHT